MTDAQAFQLIRHELARARAKHPAWPSDYVHAAAIVAEESGELIQAALQHQYEGGSTVAMSGESVHTAVTAIRFLTER